MTLDQPARGDDDVFLQKLLRLDRPLEAREFNTGYETTILWARLLQEKALARSLGSATKGPSPRASVAGRREHGLR